MLFRIVTGMTRTQKQVAFVVFDGLTVLCALILAQGLALPGGGLAPAGLWLPPGGFWLAACLIGAGALLGLRLGLAGLKLNAFDMRGLSRTAAYATCLGLLCAGIAPVFGLSLPLGAHVLFALLVLVISAGWRLLLRRITEAIYLQGDEVMRVLVYGAGATGRQFVAALRNDPKIRPVAFVDDNPTLQSQTLEGLKVHAPTGIEALVAARRIDRVVLAIPSMTRPEVARIRHRLRHVGCEVHALPSFAALVGAAAWPTPAGKVSITDLLGHHRPEQKLPGVAHAYRGRSIMITGAGGSIGSELCRQLITCAPRRIVLVDHSELALYTIEKQLRAYIADHQTADNALEDNAFPASASSRASAQNPEIVIAPVLGSVLDEKLMRRAILENAVDVVLHAAAYKHVPLVETNPLIGLKNNVLGTKALAELARHTGVERFILVSSDKAVRPTNVMGASKRLAELVVQDLASRSPGTCFSMVRFGNVLGSSGSVIPLFEEQIAQGGPVTLTDPDVTRYFMTIPEAARLVLLTGSFARGGDVFVLDMGDPVPVRLLARQMIEGAGYSVRDADSPEGDIEIAITGLRPGEKLHEELLISSDMLTTPHPKILRAQESRLSEFEVATALKDLRLAVDLQDEEHARAVIARWVERPPQDGPAQQIG